MGYYTEHTLKIVVGDLTIQDIYHQFEDDNLEFEGFEYALDRDGSSLDSVKWYSHEEDMRKLSKLYPDAVFLLEGEGEENGDIWKEYYKDGKMQRCQARLVFEEYDENKLR